MYSEISPFGLPVELCEIIFNHLSGRELLTCMCVSLTWQEFILNLKSFDKIALRISGKFRRMEITRSYKYVRLFNADCDKFAEYLKNFCAKAKKVDIISCCSKGYHDSINLKSLEELTLSRVSSDVLQLLMSLHDNLHVLNVHHLNLKLDVQTLIDFLKLNERLKEINFYLNESCNVFAQNIDGCKFNLTSISISFQSNFEADEETLSNIEQLLKKQGNSLQVISLINAASVSTIYRAWNFLKRLQRLHFFTSTCDFEEPPQHVLDTKATLISLEFHVLGPVEIDFSQDLKPILNASTNLKFLGTWKLEKDLVEHAALNLMKLKKISCATMDDGCEAFYVQLKSKNGINKKFAIHQYL